MSKDLNIGISVEVFSVGAGVWQQMTGQISPLIGWPIIAICVIIGGIYLYRGIRGKNDIARSKKLTKDDKEYMVRINSELQDINDYYEILLNQ